MKAFFKGFILRGLVAAGGGPVVLAVIYGIWGTTGTVSVLTPREVCLGILTVTLLAFIVAGMTAIYQVEKLPLPTAILLHGGALYLAYLLIYLLNGWLQKSLVPILVFTGIFILGYAAIWLIIYCVEKNKIEKLNEQLKS